MLLKDGLELIRKTEDGNSMVDLEYVTADINRGTGGDLRKCTGVKVGSANNEKSNGTITIMTDLNVHQTIHVPLIMKINGELVE